MFSEFAFFPKNFPKMWNLLKIFVGTFENMGPELPPPLCLRCVAVLVILGIWISQSFRSRVRAYAIFISHLPDPCADRGICRDSNREVLKKEKSIEASATKTSLYDDLGARPTCETPSGDFARCRSTRAHAAEPASAAERWQEWTGNGARLRPGTDRTAAARRRNADGAVTATRQLPTSTWLTTTHLLTSSTTQVTDNPPHYWQSL